MNRQRNASFKKGFLLPASIILALFASVTLGAETSVYVLGAADSESQEEASSEEFLEAPVPDNQTVSDEGDSRRDGYLSSDDIADCGGSASNEASRASSPATCGSCNSRDSSDYRACADGGDCGVFARIARNAWMEAGAVSMRGPIDGSDQGNAGLDFAVNWGSERPVWRCWHVQAGVRGAFTDLNGVESNIINIGGARSHSHSQIFGTFGFYNRAPVDCDGFSGGLAYDILAQSGYRNFELSQLRTELSYNSSSDRCEFGFRGAFALNEDSCDYNLMGILSVPATARASSYYSLFARKRFQEGAEATVFGGATEWGEGLLGAEAEAPLTARLSLKGSASCVLPKDRGILRGVKQEEAWNVSVGLTWSLGGKARTRGDSRRPLFDVADNGSFLQNWHF